jgi:hypothetical protein
VLWVSDCCLSVGIPDHQSSWANRAALRYAAPKTEEENLRKETLFQTRGDLSQASRRQREALRPAKSPLKTGDAYGHHNNAYRGIAGPITNSPRLSFWIKSSSTRRILCEANAAYAGVAPKYQDRVVLTGEWVKRTELGEEPVFLFRELKILKP